MSPCVCFASAEWQLVCSPCIFFMDEIINLNLKTIGPNPYFFWQPGWNVAA